MSRHINEMKKTKLANKGRAAGTGISEDDYSENSSADLGYIKIGRFSPFLQKKQEQPEEPVYTYNEKGEKIIWEPKKEDKTNDPIVD